MRILKFILFFVFLSGVPVFAQAPKSKVKKKAPQTLFLRKVEEAVRLHDADALLGYMDPGYKTKQHDEFHAGNTVQFLNEFFWCEENIAFNEITEVVLISYRPRKKESNDYVVVFYISNGKKQCECIFYMRHHANTKVYTIYGAVG